jgi:AraC family transcriptional activator of pobA
MSLLLALVIQMLRLSEYTHDLQAPRHDRRSQQVIAFRELVNRHFREHLSLTRFPRDHRGDPGTAVS